MYEVPLSTGLHCAINNGRAYAPNGDGSVSVGQGLYRYDVDSDTLTDAAFSTFGYTGSFSSLPFWQDEVADYQNRLIIEM
jgi:hypothetical protein